MTAIRDLPASPTAPPVPTADSRPTPLPPRVRSRRNPALLAAGAALIVAGAAGTAWLVTSMSNAEPVLAAAREIPAGHVLAAADVAVVQVGVDPAVATVPADQRDRLLGQRAASDLPAGQLLAPGSTTSDPIPAPGRSLVGVAVQPGQLPATPLGAGDPVTLVATPGDGQELPTTANPSMSATVVTTRPLDNGSTVVDVTVPTDRAATLAGWVSTGRVSIVRDPVAP